MLFVRGFYCAFPKEASTAKPVITRKLDGPRVHMCAMHLEQSQMRHRHRRAIMITYDKAKML